jgi:hypothetical protein
MLRHIPLVFAGFLCACSGGSSVASIPDALPDQSTHGDGGSHPDSGHPRDSGSKHDSGKHPDGASLDDGGPIGDAGEGGLSGDAGDGGAEHDGGDASDGGPSGDASDSGAMHDGGDAGGLAGHAGLATVPGGVKASSPSYQLVMTTGQSPGGNRVMSSPSYRMTGGVVGATQGK